MLGDTAAMLVERYGGDLRRLRDAAERRLCARGIGDVGADIFCRETQLPGTRCARSPIGVLEGGGSGSRTTPEARQARVAGGLARLLAAPVRMRLAGDFGEVLEAASR